MLEGKNIVLTGANRGIGNAILQLLSTNHANVWCLVRSMDESFIQQIEQLQKQNDVWIKVIHIDLADMNSVKCAAQEIINEKLPVYGLINNAGINWRGSFMTMTEKEMQLIFQTNYYAPLKLIQLLAKRMIRQKEGNIINILSSSGYEHRVGTFLYGNSKAALLWATQTISRELAPYGIRVNGISPGVTDTAINEAAEEIIQKEVISQMNIARKAEPVEIAEVILFLLSKQSSFISGQIIRVDGGRFCG